VCVGLLRLSFRCEFFCVLVVTLRNSQQKFLHDSWAPPREILDNMNVWIHEYLHMQPTLFMSATKFNYADIAADMEPFEQSVYCSVLQCVAVCCSVLQCAAVCCSVLQCVAVYCSVLQCAAVCCSVLQCAAVYCSVFQCIVACYSVLLLIWSRRRAKTASHTWSRLKSWIFEFMNISMPATDSIYACN